MDDLLQSLVAGHSTPTKTRPGGVQQPTDGAAFGEAFAALSLEDHVDAESEPPLQEHADDSVIEVASAEQIEAEGVAESSEISSEITVPDIRVFSPGPQEKLPSVTSNVPAFEQAQSWAGTPPLDERVAGLLVPAALLIPVATHAPIVGTATPSVQPVLIPQPTLIPGETTVASRSSDFLKSTSVAVPGMPLQAVNSPSGPAVQHQSNTPMTPTVPGQTRSLAGIGQRPSGIEMPVSTLPQDNAQTMPQRLNMQLTRTADPLPGSEVSQPVSTRSMADERPPLPHTTTPAPPPTFPAQTRSLQLTAITGDGALPPGDDASPVAAPRVTSAAANHTPNRSGSWSNRLNTTAMQFAPAPTPLPPATTTQAEFTVDPLPEGEFAFHTVSQTTSAPVSTPAHIGHLPPASTQAVAQQIAAALNDPARDIGAPIELALDPPELGRVRMHMAEIAGVMTLTIHAERPETADLMRRHLDLLAQEFAEAGLDAPSVRISQDGADQENQQQGVTSPDDHSRSETTAPDDSPILPTQRRTTSGALDLRL